MKSSLTSTNMNTATAISGSCETMGAPFSTIHTSRKRAAPISIYAQQPRRLWRVVSAAVVLSSSVSAFQSTTTIPLSYSKACSIPTRDGTSSPLWVLTEPNNVMEMETLSRQADFTDRAALEELYVLSSAADSENAQNQKRKTKKIIKTTTSRTKATTNRSRMTMKRPNNGNQSSTLNKLVSEFVENPESESQPRLAQIKDKSQLVITQQQRKPQFKGLTTNPNRRNLREKRLSTVSPVVRNPTLSGIMPGSGFEDRLRLKDDRPSITKESATGSLPITNSAVPKPVREFSNNSKKNNYSSKSSTMPGFRDRGQYTDRQIAYNDGIKIAEQRSGRKFIESETALENRKKRNADLMYKSSASVPDSLARFAHEIHSVDRITPEEEVVLGVKTQEAIRLQKIYDGLVAKLDREPTDDEWCAAAGKINMAAILQTIEDGLEAKNRLVISNLRMVQGVVNVYIRNGLQGNYNAGDLMQEGIMALIRAAEKFDPSRGFKFSTYAMYWIRAGIKSDQLHQSRVIPVPQRIHEYHKRITKMRRELTESLNRRPTNAELSHAVGLPEAQIEKVERALAQKTHSLDQNIAYAIKVQTSDDAKESMHGVVASKPDENEYRSRKAVQFREDLLNLVHSHLTEEEATLLLLRFNLMDDARSSGKSGLRTIAEISDIVGFKPDKVRRMIHGSLRQLQSVIGDEWREYEREVEATVV